MAELPFNGLKIGIVLDDSLDKVDGVQQYVIAIGEWLRTQGHDVHYLVGATQRQDLKGIHSLSRNVAVRFNRNRMSMPLPTSRAKLRHFLAAEQFDVLHVQLPYSPYLAHRLILDAGDLTAVVGTFHIIAHGAIVRAATRVLGGWTRQSLNRFDDIVSVSSAAADFAKRTFGVTTSVLPNTFDYRQFHTAQPLEAYDDATPTILFLGRLVPRKGCQLLLEAVARLSERPEPLPFRVLICGKGPLADKLQRFVKNHKLTDRVTFVGFVSEANKPRYYASANISVFPSSGGESFGIVLLEAMASGRAAVLAGDNPGYRSVMLPHSELLFNPHDSAELAEKLELYLTDKTARSKAQRWGMEYTEDFDTTAVGNRLLDIYHQALRKRRRG